MQIIRKISENEMQQINPKIIEKLGAECIITSGSVENCSERVRYNIVTYQKELPEETLKKVGKIVKQKLFADEVFYLGRKIA